ncbi:MAG: DUF5829 family protein [Chryseobacterium sp.]|jgi:hypothetical protein|uniref:DUF5829 family protein n=1 Tax=Chryseobacterium sp. TaxID=1871047 RepID=UPI00282FC077|nr:DUF5829 family protein [Chryseobacterium sp.]MDR2235156.1 DUF5829 family protein [Chryseobacterium sp.]
MKNLIFLIFFMVSGSKAFGQNDVLKLNHIYFVLDSASFEEVKSNKQLMQWANWDKGLPDFDPVDNKSTTAYLRGKSTYLEIMGPNNKFGEKTGSIGIGFSWDVYGEFSDSIDKKLKKKKLKFEKSESTWDFGNKKILWYSAYYTNLKGSLGTWYAFYNPDFLTHLYHMPYAFFTREAFLNNKINKDRAIKDLSGMILDCNIKDYHKMTEEFATFGITAKDSGKNFITFEVDSVEIKLNLTNRETTMIRQLRLEAEEKLAENLKIGKLNFQSIGKELVINFN